MRNRVLFMGDSYRGDQEQNIKRLFDLFAPVVMSCGGLPELCVSALNRRSGPEAWMSDWIESLKGECSSVLNGSDLDRVAIIAFELSWVDRQYLDAAGVPWVNFEIHPVRFLDDLYFNVETSFAADFSSLEVPDDYIHVRADVLRARYGFLDEVCSKRLLIVGQTPIDKSIYFDGVFKSLPDYFDSLDSIVQSFDAVDYRPHPYLTDTEVDTLIRDRYSAGQCADWDFYRLLASCRYGAVCGISSSTLREAAYFGLESIVLEKRAKTFGRPVSYACLLRDSHLWLSGLLETAIDSRKYESLPPVPENYLRQVYCSWAYITKEDEAKELLSELKERVAASHENAAQSEVLAMQARLEERLASAEARAAQVEQNMVKAEAIAAEFSGSLEAVKSELVESRTVARMQQVHFEERLASAEARAAQAEQSVFKAEALAAEFRGSLEAVKSELVESRTVARMQQAHFEERLASAEARAAQAEQSRVMTETQAAELNRSLESVKNELVVAQAALRSQQARFVESEGEQQIRLSDLEQQLTDALTNNHYHWQLANERAEELARISGLYDQVNQALHASEAAQSRLAAERDKKSGDIQYWHQRVLDLHASTSWQLTKPLRGLKRLINREAGVRTIAGSSAGSGELLRSSGRKLLAHSIRYVFLRPALRSRLSTLLKRTPVLHQCLRRIGFETGAIGTYRIPPEVDVSLRGGDGNRTDPSLRVCQKSINGNGRKRSVDEIFMLISAELGFDNNTKKSIKNEI
jgi:hypothetical protein